MITLELMHKSQELVPWLPLPYAVADPGLSVRGGRIKQTIQNGVGAGGDVAPSRPSQGVWGSAVNSPMKLFKFRIIKLQKDKNFSYFFLRTKSKHEQRTQTVHAHTKIYFENLNQISMI